MACKESTAVLCALGVLARALLFISRLHQEPPVYSPVSGKIHEAPEERPVNGALGERALPNDSTSGSPLRGFLSNKSIPFRQREGVRLLVTKSGQDARDPR